MKKLLPLLVILFCTIQSFAQSNQIVKKKFHDGKLNQQDSTIGYTEAVQVDNVLYISGSIGRGTVGEQLQDIYTNLGKVLNAYGATYQNVVKETLFTTDIEAVKTNNAVRTAFYKGDFPAATWIQISRLFPARADAQIEIELIAHLPKTVSKGK